MYAENIITAQSNLPLLSFRYNYDYEYPDQIKLIPLWHNSVHSFGVLHSAYFALTNHLTTFHLVLWSLSVIEHTFYFIYLIF